ncbi:unnamed protein product [Urochloa decumbens]|uniref:DUF4220 domain-containing protein n=1 Tax=Urochloa decumbens TaxID=240449 RepID=A0ABC9BYS8_9POAL
MFVTSVVQFWSEWGLRISVLGSLAAYTILGLLSGARRRSASGRRSILRWAVVLILWATYQAAELTATAALGSLSLSGSDVSADEQQLIVFWAPFLLLHLGGPDNITAYTLEDNLLSLRKGLEMILQLLGVMYAIWNYIYGSHSWVLLAASVIMLVIGGVRYVERAWALWRANLDNMQHSSKSKKKPEVVVESAISRILGRDLDDGEALLLAQDLFHIWRRALFDSSVDMGSASQSSSEKLVFSRGWRSMCQVVEMELSLMYEVLYTKASLAHTCRAGTCYLVIRLMSPPAYASAGWLFWLYSNKKGRQLRGSFVLITYLLLGAAFAMDVVWLLRALGSTWTYYLFKKKAWRWPWAWFHRHVLCAGRWRWLHRAVVYLDPLRLVLGLDPVRHKRWSGTIGRYNLLHECTVRRRPWCLWLATKAGLEETRYLSGLLEGVKELLFERVLRIVPRADNPSHPQSGAYTMVDITTCWGQEALRRDRYLFRGGGLPVLAREFEQDVLAWHIATTIFLSRTMVRNLPKSSASGALVAAIETMSEYLMFPVTERRQMLPGLVLHSLLEETRGALEEIWDDYCRNNEEATSSRHTSRAAAGRNKEKLASLVRQKRNSGRKWADESNGNRLVFDAAVIAGALTNSSKRQQQVAQMLELIFNVWVDKLLYAAIRCSRESHAKQLSCGGELTTVLWMVVQHAGPFRIGQEMPEEEKKRHGKKFEEKKPEEKKKKKGEEPHPAWWLPPDPEWAPYRPYYYPKPQAEEPQMPMQQPVPMTVQEEPEDEVDPEDAKDYRTPIEYITLY